MIFGTAWCLVIAVHVSLSTNFHSAASVKCNTRVDTNPGHTIRTPGPVSGKDLCFMAPWLQFFVSAYNRLLFTYYYLFIALFSTLSVYFDSLPVIYWFIMTAVQVIMSLSLTCRLSPLSVEETGVISKGTTNLFHLPKKPLTSSTSDFIS